MKLEPRYVKDCPFCGTELKGDICPKCFAYRVEDSEDTMSKKEIKERLKNGN